MRFRVRWLWALLLTLTAAGPAWTCNVPVFRYALERWTPDDYTVTIFHRGPLTPEQQRLVEGLHKLGRRDGGRANLLVEPTDVSGELGPSLDLLWKAQKNAPLPWVAVQEPNPEDGTAWQGLPLTETERFRKLTDSPGRRKVARHLLDGEAVIWLLVTGTDAKANSAARQLLDETSAMLSKKLKLPEGIGEPGSTLMSTLPLRISFATVSISREDAEEKALVGLLEHIFPTGTPETDPVVVPIFGRGRALDVIAGEDLTAETLTDAAVFLTGRCSCQVKRLNPGVDLLVSADWESIFAEDTPDPARPSQEVPLVALPEAQSSDPEGTEPVLKCGTPDTPSETAVLPRVLLWSVGGAGVGLILATVLLLRRGGAA